MSWKCEVLLKGEREWVSNGLRFATEREAEEYGKELDSRWWVTKELRSTPSDDPVNYRFDFVNYRAVPIEKE